jgi:hypothetical protein
MTVIRSFEEPEGSTAASASAGFAPSTAQMPAVRPEQPPESQRQQAPLQMTQLASSSDRCAMCGAEMAPDQSYCVECGTRRGKARFSLSQGAQAAPLAAVTPTRSHRFSPSSTVLVGLAVLILSLGVGVLIGRSGSGTGKQPPINVVVGGAAGAGAAGAATPASGSGNSSGASNHSKSSGSSKVPSSSKGSAGVSALANKANAPKSAKARSNVVNKALNHQTTTKNGKTIPSATAKVGSKCTAGTVGCVNGIYQGSGF